MLDTCNKSVVQFSLQYQVLVVLRKMVFPRKRPPHYLPLGDLAGFQHKSSFSLFLDTLFSFSPLFNNFHSFACWHLWFSLQSDTSFTFFFALDIPPYQLHGDKEDFQHKSIFLFLKDLPLLEHPLHNAPSFLMSILYSHKLMFSSTFGEI